MSCVPSRCVRGSALRLLSRPHVARTTTTPSSSLSSTLTWCVHGSGMSRRGFYDKVRDFAEYDGDHSSVDARKQRRATTNAPAQQQQQQQQQPYDKDDDDDAYNTADGLLQRKYGASDDDTPPHLQSVLAIVVSLVLGLFVYESSTLSEPPLDRYSHTGMQHPLIQQYLQQHPPQRHL